MWSDRSRMGTMNNCSTSTDRFRICHRKAIVGQAIVRSRLRATLCNEKIIGKRRTAMRHVKVECTYCPPKCDESRPRKVRDWEMHPSWITGLEALGAYSNWVSAIV